jgi:lipopolysaccharide biosynthesis protein
MKVLVLYVYHQYHDRVKHFIDHALFEDEHVDFIFICNDSNTSIELPPYVKQMTRENRGYDFGGWSDALLTQDIYKDYDRFIFVNSSVMGPYLPSYYKGKWTDIYLEGLRDNVKLFGSTINTIQNPYQLSHVQSYIFAMDKTTLEYLIECEIFSMTCYASTFLEAVWKKEVLMSRKIIGKGWNIGSLFDYYKDVDFTFTTKHHTQYPFPFLDDIMYPPFRGKLWNEHELVFIKGNRVPIHKTK